MAQYKIYKDINDKYRWRLVANNGEKICWSEAYESKQGAKDSIDFVKKYAAGADVNDLT